MEPSPSIAAARTAEATAATTALRKTALRAFGRWMVTPTGRREIARLRRLANLAIPFVAVHSDELWDEASVRSWWDQHTYALVVYRREPDGSETMIAGLTRRRDAVGPTGSTGPTLPTQDPAGRVYAAEDTLQLSPASARLTVGDVMDWMFAEAPDDASAFIADRGLALLV